jgi:hypothetical protein
MTCFGSKNDFCKKSGARLISGKVQTHPGSSEIGKRLRKIQKITPKVCATKRELICVSQMAYYLCGGIYVGCSAQLSVSHFGSCLTKKSYFGTSKIENALFMGRNENRPSWHSSPSQGPRPCMIWPRFDKLCLDQDQTWLI